MRLDRKTRLVGHLAHPGERKHERDHQDKQRQHQYLKQEARDVHEQIFCESRHAKESGLLRTFRLLGPPRARLLGCSLTFSA